MTTAPPISADAVNALRETLRDPDARNRLRAARVLLAYDIRQRTLSLVTPEQIAAAIARIITQQPHVEHEPSEPPPPTAQRPRTTNPDRDYSDSAMRLNDLDTEFRPAAIRLLLAAAPPPEPSPPSSRAVPSPRDLIDAAGAPRTCGKSIFTPHPPLTRDQRAPRPPELPSRSITPHTG